MTCHSSAFWKFCALDESTVQDALAPSPPPPEKLIFGADVYPLPPETNVMAVTAPPPEMVAVADAPLPPPPENDIVGAEVYPVPPLVMEKVEDIVAGPHSALQDAGGDDKLRKFLDAQKFTHILRITSGNVEGVMFVL
jgi:hypothetical protein